MDWSNLKENKCPKCRADLIIRGFFDGLYFCKNEMCDFKISPTKFDQIVSKPSKVRVRDTSEENLSELNNL